MDSQLRGARAERLVQTFHRDGRVEVRFSRLMVAVYLVLGIALIGCGALMFGIAGGVVSPGTGSRDGTVFPGIVAAVIGLMLLGLGIGQARSGRPPVVADRDGVHVLGVCVPWAGISGFGSYRDRRGRYSHVVASILVDEATARSWANDQQQAKRTSQLYGPGLVDPHVIALPHNLAVGPEPLGQALEAIRLEVASVSG